jgi:hypothetical protein
MVEMFFTSWSNQDMNGQGLSSENCTAKRAWRSHKLNNTQNSILRKKTIGLE